MNNEEIIYKGIKSHLGLPDDLAAAMLMSGKFPVYHTYEHWKSLGYQVKKGEHAELKLNIWKHGKPKEDEKGNPIAGKMFMKKASFFSFSQVEKLEEQDND